MDSQDVGRATLQSRLNIHETVIVLGPSFLEYALPYIEDECNCREHMTGIDIRTYYVSI